MTQQTSEPRGQEEELQGLVETDELDPGDLDDNPVLPDDLDAHTLRPNKLISEHGIYAFRKQARVNTIVLIGEQKSGKTTLLAALYGLFCKGPIGALEFVDSRTLYSFAERNHLALLDEDRETPTVPRTSIADAVGYFHLKLRNAGSDCDIIISDRSGETFEAARVDTSLIDRLTEMGLANRVCFLLDASRLTSVETRAGYRRIFKQTIRALIDNDVIPPMASIEVLVTKIDRVSRIHQGRDLLAEVAEYENELRRDFSSSGHYFGVYRICALPRASLKVGFLGLQELLERWTTQPEEVDISPIPVKDASRYIDRAFYTWSSK